MSSKKNIFRSLGGLAVAILLPLFFFAMLEVYSKGKVRMPIVYGAEGIKSDTVNGKIKYDTIYRRVADIVLKNQLGRTISLNNDLQGKTLVISLFSINCTDSCEKLTHNMEMLQKAFKKDTKKEFSLDVTVQFISISTDPANDSCAALRAYADHYHANHDHWWFLTGDKNSICNFAAKQLSIPGADSIAAGPIQTTTVVVVDRNRHIRGYYNGLDYADMKRCADDVVLVALQK